MTDLTDHPPTPSGDALTRERIAAGDYLQLFPTDLPGQPLWSRERILASLEDTLARRPSAAPVWLFGYGSLIWNPQLRYAERQPARLDGWQRRFCLELRAGRATPDHPGRMAALVAGGHCAGAAYRMEDGLLRPELELVWIREMVYGDYLPTWVTVRLRSGAAAQALTFVADTRLRQCRADASVAVAAPLIAATRGPLGSNLDYLLELDTALAARGIEDAYVRALAAAARRCAQTLPAPAR